MKIQYCSDLHLEFKENKRYLKEEPLIPAAEVLVLAGDIVPFGRMKDHKHFFNFVSDHFETTYWLPGNHEYYHADAALRSGVVNEKIRSNVFLVNNHVVDHENTRLIFSTLWSHISPAHEWEIERSVSDFAVIRYKEYKFSAVPYNELHRQALNFITTELEKDYAGKTIVVTHHMPTMLNYPAHYKSSPINEAFAVELFDLIEKSEIDCWIYGHHHTNTPEFTIGKTRMLTNQLGYVHHGEHRAFDHAKTITL